MVTIGWRHPSSTVTKMTGRLICLGIPKKQALAMSLRWVMDNGAETVSRWLRPRRSRGRVVPRGSGQKGESR